MQNDQGCYGIPAKRVNCQVSPSCGTGFSTSSGPSTVTGLQVTYTTSGLHPVVVQLIPDGSGNTSYCYGSSTSQPSVSVRFQRFLGPSVSGTATIVALFSFGVNGSTNYASMPGTAFSHVELGLAPGTYTYNVTLAVSSGSSTSAGLASVKLMVYEDTSRIVQQN